MQKSDEITGLDGNFKGPNPAPPTTQPESIRYKVANNFTKF